MFLGFVLWILFCVFVSEVLPDLCQLIWHVMKFSARVSLFVAKDLFRLSVFLGIQCFRIGKFGYFLVCELINDAQRVDEAEEQDSNAYVSSSDLSYEEACFVLGLEPNATNSEIDRAYKSAIKLAHPDLGGSADQAALINQARVVIKLKSFGT